MNTKIDNYFMIHMNRKYVKCVLNYQRKVIELKQLNLRKNQENENPIN